MEQIPQWYLPVFFAVVLAAGLLGWQAWRYFRSPVGFGWELERNSIGGGLLIKSCLPRSPASRANIRAGSVLMEYRDEPMTFGSHEEMEEYWRQEQHSLRVGQEISCYVSLVGNPPFRYILRAQHIFELGLRKIFLKVLRLFHRRKVAQQTLGGAA